MYYGISPIDVGKHTARPHAMRLPGTVDRAPARAAVAQSTGTRPGDTGHSFSEEDLA